MDKIDKINNNKRKIYGRDEMLKLYICPKEVPMYLKDFPYVYNNYEMENWCKRPLPKFKPDKHKNIMPPRLRTSSNAGDGKDENTERPLTIPYAEKYRPPHRTVNRRFSQNMSEDKERNMLDPSDFHDEHDWKKVERINKYSTANRPYSHNLYNTENNWKKWTVSEQQQGQPHQSKPNYKNSRPIQFQKNCTWNRKDVFRPRQQSVPNQNENVEEMWQDDFESELSKDLVNCNYDEMDLDAFQLPDSTMPRTPTSPRDILMSQTNPPTAEEYKLVLLEQSKNMWYYRDLSDQEIGPYHSNNMANWFATGFFNHASFVRRQCDERFFLIAEYRAMYKRIPFTEGTTIPQILAHTKIDPIEPKDLIAGVDESLKPLILSQSTICITNCQQTAPMIPPGVICNPSPTNTNAPSPHQFKTDERDKEEERQRQLAERERILEEKEIEIMMKEKQMRLDLEKKEIEDRERALREKEEIIRKKEEEMRQRLEKLELLAKKQVDMEKLELLDKNQAVTEKSEPVTVNEVKRHDKSSEEWTWSSVKPTTPTVTQHNNSEEIIRKKNVTTDAPNQQSNIPKNNKKIQKQVEYKERKDRLEADLLDGWLISQVKKTNKPSNSQCKVPLVATDPVKSNVSEKPALTTKSGEVHSVQNQKTKQWNIGTIIKSHQTPTVTTNMKAPVNVKSISEIQAEEEAAQKLEKQKQLEQRRIIEKQQKNSQLTSFKDSILKSSNTAPPSSVKQAANTTKAAAAAAAAASTRKNIWDMVSSDEDGNGKDTEYPPISSTVNKSKISNAPTKTNTTSTLAGKVATQKPVAINSNQTASVSNDQNNNSNGNTKKNKKTDIESLMDWCCVKLAIYGNENRDISVISSMIASLPDNEIEEFATEYLGDTEPIKSFCKEFIGIRNEQIEKRASEAPWMTVKKPITPNQHNKPTKNANNTKSGKKKKKQANK